MKKKHKRKRFKRRVFKRIIGGSAIVLALILFLIPSFAKAVELSGNVLANGQCGEDSYWQVYENGVLVIYGSSNMWNFRDDEYGSERGWKDYKDIITTVAFTGNMKHVGDYAFKDHTSIREIDLSGSVTTISTEAFKGCGDISVVRLSEDLGWIRANAFEGTNIDTVEFGGTKEQWEYLRETSEAQGNQPLFNATNIKYLGEPEPIEYIVAFLVDGEIVSRVYVKEGESASFPEEEPEKEGCRFIGWRPSDLSNITHDQIVTAMFEKIVDEHIVRFYVDGEMINEQVVINGLDAYDPNYTPPDGYEFSGWDPADFSNVTDDMNIYGTTKKKQSSGGGGSEEDPDNPGGGGGSDDPDNPGGGGGENEDPDNPGGGGGENEDPDEEPAKPWDGSIDNIDNRDNAENSDAFTATVTPEPEIDLSLWVRDSDGRFFRADDLKRYSDYQFYGVSLVDSNKRIYKSFNKFVMTMPIPSRMNLSLGKVTLVARRADGYVVYPEYEIIDKNGVMCFKFSAAADAEYGILYEESGGENSEEEGDLRKDETDNKTKEDSDVKSDDASKTTDYTNKKTEEKKEESSDKKVQTDNTKVDNTIKTISNVYDMPKTGEYDILRILVAFVLLAFGLLELVSTISVKKRIR